MANKKSRKQTFGATTGRTLHNNYYDNDIYEKIKMRADELKAEHRNTNTSDIIRTLLRRAVNEGWLEYIY